MAEEFWPVELIPMNEELSMLTIAFVGSQEKTAGQLEVLVTEHGGTFSKDVPAKGEVCPDRDDSPKIVKRSSQCCFATERRFFRV